jgi:hypothetical protein
MHLERRPNPDRSLEAVAARLRALPQPAVPDGVEARLLAAIPAGRPIPRRRRVLWAGMAGALAAACLLAALAWLGRDGKGPVPSPSMHESAHAQGAGLPPALRPDHSAGIAPWLEARRALDGGEMPTFTWPLQKASPLRGLTSIPHDLLD